MRNLTLAALALIGSALFVEDASAGLRKRGKRGGCGGGGVSHCGSPAPVASCGGCAAAVAPACGSCATAATPACGSGAVACTGVPAGVTMTPSTGVIVQASGTEPMPGNVNQMPIVPAMYSTPATISNTQGRRGLFRR